MFKKTWNISLIILDYYHPHQTFKCRLMHSSCILTIFKESEVKWGRGGFTYLRVVLVWYYCLGVRCLLRESPFSEHVLNLYLGNLSLIYSASCWKLKKLDHSLFLRTLALISRMGDLVSSTIELAYVSHSSQGPFSTPGLLWTWLQKKTYIQQRDQLIIHMMLKFII